MVSSLNNVLSNETKHRDQRRQNTARALARGGPTRPRGGQASPATTHTTTRKSLLPLLDQEVREVRALRIRLTGSLTARDALRKK